MTVKTIQDAKASLSYMREQHKRATESFNPMIAADAAKKAVGELLPVLDFILAHIEGVNHGK